MLQEDIATSGLSKAYGSSEIESSLGDSQVSCQLCGCT
jgi:hypothetical protein